MTYLAESFSLNHDFLYIDKTIQRNNVDAIFDEYAGYFKDAGSKSTLNDMITLLFSLNLIEK